MINMKKHAKQRGRLEENLIQRRRKERRFKRYGQLAVLSAGLILLVLLYNIVAPGLSGFMRHELRMDFEAVTAEQDTVHMVRAAVKELSGTEARAEYMQARRLVSSGARHEINSERESLGDGESLSMSVPLADSADMWLKGKYGGDNGPLSDQQVRWLQDWQERGLIETHFNSTFFSQGDSREPEQAGFWGSIVGSIFTLLVCMALAFPVGVAAAVYLEEFARKNTLTDFVEVNINNLAAVPSIIFGLLGLSVYLNFFGLPRSSALVGGLTLALMTLPVVIITTRVALKAVPPSMRDAARGLGASPVQVVFHHVLPYAMPGIMTGTILGMARAIGETAPLLMIGMVAFVADIPRGFTDPSSAMPVQIYLWASSPEMGFVEKTSSGIAVLLVLLMVMNALAIYLRKKYEMTW